MPPRSLAALPDAAVALIVASLACPDRLRLRLTCRALAAAAAEALSGVCVDAAEFEAGGAAAKRSLARACPRAVSAVLRVRTAAERVPSRESVYDLVAVLLSSKPLLQAVKIQEQRSDWEVAPLHQNEPVDWLGSLARACGLGGSGGSIQQLDMELENAPSAADLAVLRHLPGLRELSLRMRSPHRAGLSPEGLAWLAELPLTRLAVAVDSTNALQVWRALCEAWPGSPLAESLESLWLRCTGPGHVALPASWLLKFPRLRRLDCHSGVAIDFEDFEEELRASGLPLPPLEHLELDQAELDASGCAALAGGGLLGARLTSLVLSRCRLPARDELLRLGAAGVGGDDDGGTAAGGPLSAARAEQRQQLVRRNPPFHALRQLTLGVSEPDASLTAVAALTGLRDLTLLHLRTGERGFAAGAARRLAALTGLTRLVMVPAASKIEFRWEGPGGGGGVPVAAAAASGVAGSEAGFAPAAAVADGGSSSVGGQEFPTGVFPLLQSYRGPKDPGWRL